MFDSVAMSFNKAETAKSFLDVRIFREYKCYLFFCLVHSLEEEQQTRGSVTAEIAGAAPVRTAIK